MSPSEQVCVDPSNWAWGDCRECGAALSKASRFRCSPPPWTSLTTLARYQETYDVVRQVVDENGGEVKTTPTNTTSSSTFTPSSSTFSPPSSLQIQYVDVAEFLVRQMEGKFHTTDLRLMQVPQRPVHQSTISPSSPLMHHTVFSRPIKPIKKLILP